LVIYNIVYFAVPGPVEELLLDPGSDNITVKWEKPTSNSDCVTNYVIHWVKALSESSGNRIALSEVYSFTIVDLDACEVYSVSVTAVNADNKGDGTVTGTVTTGNYHTHIILLCL
jgi:hypothetical protein